MAEKRYEFADSIVLTRANAVELLRMDIDFKQQTWQVVVQVLDTAAGGKVVATRTLSFPSLALLNSYVGAVKFGTVSQTNFEEGVLKGVTIFENSIPGGGTLVDVVNPNELPDIPGGGGIGGS